MNQTSIAGLLMCCVIGCAAAEPVEPKPASDPANAEKVSLPGITIDAENKRVDVAAKIALDEGLLELIACTTDTKEHESLVIIDAVPMHIHAALLLIGASNGHPARAEPANEEKTEWLHLPPRGDPIAISLVYPDPKDKDKTIERPISDFLKRAEPDPVLDEDGQEGLEPPAKVFETFLFAGSAIVKGQDGEQQYVADESGNVVSISTFGDELLCLPSRISQENTALVWSVNDQHLPKAGTKVTMRLTLIEQPKKEAE